jgi:hypothetical protein
MGVFLMLVHELGCKHPEQWNAMSTKTRAAGCPFEVVVHPSKSVNAQEVKAGKEFIASRMVPEDVREHAKWGDISVTRAMFRTLAWAMEVYPSAKVFYFVSGTDVPLQGPKVSGRQGGS